MDENFYLRHEADTKFPFELNELLRHEAIRQFQAHTDNAIKYLDYICYCYSRFLDPSQLKHIFDNHLVVIAIFDVDILHYHEFDCLWSFW